jgi:hypothetical protein
MKRGRPRAASLEAVLAALQALPWSQRCRLRVQPGEKGILVERDGMYAFVTPLRNGNVNVGYEQALQEGASEELTPEAATPFLLRVLGRERLCRLERADAEATEPLAGGAEGRDTEERG